jgi:tRNA A-37 threonylcarbamoyl transferase component Bud32
LRADSDRGTAPDTSARGPSAKGGSPGKPPRVLANRYELGRAIARGGMAAVFLGTDLVLGRKVAIKILSPQFASDQRFVARFRREAKAAAGLNHANVVSVFDTGAEGNVHYIVMEYVEGPTLEAILGEEGPLTVARSLQIAEGVCRGLMAAHAQGLVHRDVKPGNVILDARELVKVADFGIARPLDDAATLTATGVIGTAAYLSPEQAQGLPVDARSDLYSLGCLLYEMLAGRPPFDGESAVSVALKHVHAEPRPLTEANPAIPPALDALVMRALTKSPENRHESAAALAGDLRRLAGSLGVEHDAARGGRAGHEPVSRHDTAPLPVDAPRGRGRRPSARAVVLFTALAVAGFLGGRIVLGDPSEVPVPDVKLLRQGEAMRRLEGAGLQAQVTASQSEDVRRGLVVSQVPGPGQVAQTGSRVRIVVSLGPGSVVVPDLVGRSLAEAEELLAERGLRVQTGAEWTSFEPPGTVILQVPSPGTDVEPGSLVGVVVSRGVPEESDDD